jgi:hypothetical protein
MYDSFSYQARLLLIVSQLSVSVSISVTIAMYCLIQLYISVSKPLAPHQPLLKLFSIKAVGRASIPLYRFVPLKPLT